LDPRVMNMATAPLNPNWYGAWLGGMASPQSYGPALGAMLRAPYGVQPMPMLPMYVPPGYK
jgi:hypothetical protein